MDVNKPTTVKISPSVSQRLLTGVFIQDMPGNCGMRIMSGLQKFHTYKQVLDFFFAAFHCPISGFAFNWYDGGCRVCYVSAVIFTDRSDNSRWEKVKDVAAKLPSFKNINSGNDIVTYMITYDMFKPLWAQWNKENPDNKVGIKLTKNEKA